MKKIIVVGAGPAGLWIAHELKHMGYEVIVIEQKHNFDTLHRACSTQFIIDDDYEGEGIIIRNGELYFPKSDFSVPYTGKLIPVNNKYYHSPKDNIIRFALDDGKTPFSWKFDKKKMLQGLYKLCLSEGVQFRMGTIASDAKDLGTGVEVSVTVSAEDGSLKKETVSGNMLVIAEGVNAKLCQQAGMNSERRHFATALCVKHIVEGIEGVENNSWNLYYGSVYHSNAAVIIGPSIYGDGIYEVTISGDKNHKPADIYHEFITDSPMAKKFTHAKIRETMGCSVKAFNSMLHPCKGNIIAIGDSAAFVEVEVQGALLCAHHAASAIDKEFKGGAGKGWEEYTEWWKSSFEFNGEDHMRVAQGYALVPFFTDDELDYMFNLVAPTTLRGTYSQYKTPKLIWDNIFTHEKRIQKEWPELAVKIEQRKQLTLANSFAK